MAATAEGKQEAGDNHLAYSIYCHHLHGILKQGRWCCHLYKNLWVIEIPFEIHLQNYAGCNFGCCKSPKEEEAEGVEVVANLDS